MASFIVMVSFVVFQVLNFLLSKYLAAEFGLWAGIVIFLILFGISAVLVGNYASRRLVVTYEDQQREINKKNSKRKR